MLATRNQLQNKQLNESQPIFVDSVNHFNDPTYFSGGLLVPHEEFLSCGLNTEVVNKSGLLTPAIAFKLFKTVRTQYAKILPKYEA